MSGIFINYRRDHSAAWAGRLYDHLTAVFGRDQIFMDIDSILPGQDFSKIIERTLEISNVMLVLIDKDWLSAADDNGKRRIDNSGDYVRMEIESALKNNILIIPILVQGAKMPNARELPISLLALSKVQAHEITATRFNYDMEMLLSILVRDGRMKLINIKNSSSSQSHALGLVKPESAKLKLVDILIHGENVLPDNFADHFKNKDGFHEDNLHIVESFHVDRPRIEVKIRNNSEEVCFIKKVVVFTRKIWIIPNPNITMHKYVEVSALYDIQASRVAGDIRTFPISQEINANSVDRFEFLVGTDLVKPLLGIRLFYLQIALEYNEDNQRLDLPPVFLNLPPDKKVNGTFSYSAPQSSIARIKAIAENILYELPKDAVIDEKLLQAIRSWANCDPSEFLMAPWEAEAKYRENIRNNPEDSESYALLSQVLLADEQMEEAEVMARMNLRLDPNNELGHFCLGVVYSEKGDADKAAAEFRTVIRLNPENITAHYNLEVVLKQLRLDSSRTKFSTYDDAPGKVPSFRREIK